MEWANIHNRDKENGTPFLGETRTRKCVASTMAF